MMGKKAPYRKHGKNMRVRPDRFPTSAAPAEEIAPKVGVPPSRLKAWANAGCPHFEMMGEDPLFMVGQVKQWMIDSGIIRQVTGAPIDTTIKIYSRQQYEDNSDLLYPPVLAQLETLQRMDVSARGAAGIYFLCRGVEVVYVGRSVNVGSRVHSTNHLDKDFDRAFWLPISKKDLNRVEAAFISVLDPPLNKNGSHCPEAEEIVEEMQGMFRCESTDAAATVVHENGLNGDLDGL